MLQVYDWIILNVFYLMFIIMLVGLVVVIVLEVVFKVLRLYILFVFGVCYEYVNYMVVFNWLINVDIFEFDKNSFGIYVDQIQGI